MDGGQTAADALGCGRRLACVCFARFYSATKRKTYENKTLEKNSYVHHHTDNNFNSDIASKGFEQMEQFCGGALFFCFFLPLRAKRKSAVRVLLRGLGLALAHALAHAS